jgi:thiamine-phosphate pyrophosphorylase
LDKPTIEKCVDDLPVYRIIDANGNRLREALRVLEEYFRFIQTSEKYSIVLKQMRHSLEEIYTGVDGHLLMKSRNTETDPFAYKVSKEEKNRTTIQDVLAANFKRAQEAARVLEEYGKIVGTGCVSEPSKRIRFSLYELEKQVLEKYLDR